MSTSSTNSSASIPSIQIESMHNPLQSAVLLESTTTANGVPGVGMMKPGAKGFLMKKMAAAGQSFHSPSDMMVSPCTQKLVQSKKRHYTKGKPLSLSHSFQSSKLGSQLVPGQSTGSSLQNENVAPGSGSAAEKGEAMEE